MGPSNETSALMAIDRTYLYSSFEDGLQFTLNEAFVKDNHYTLFRSEDLPAWATFTGVFIVLLMFDHWYMGRTTRTLTVSSAMVYTMFWVSCAFAFCGWVYMYYGPNQAVMWMSGYMLEWMLSFDNLFVFHTIFNIYKTPDHLKHRPLYLGICGAVVFRLGFIFIGEYLMHAMFLMHLVFGSFLIYTGVKTAMTDEDDDDPSKHPMVQWLQGRMPFVSAYDTHGRFFVEVPVSAETGSPELPDGVSWRPSARDAEEGDPIVSLEDSKVPASGYGTVDPLKEKKVSSPTYCAVDFDQKFFPSTAQPARKTKNCATMLFLVLLCLEISDLLFAVDSVSAIVAQVPDLFLAYTSAVFAMLGLRATFFIIDVLAKAFSLLKYGVSVVLVFIGAKLMLARVWHVPPLIVCAVLVSSIGFSMLASVLFVGDTGEEAEKAMTPSHSPAPQPVKPRTGEAISVVC